MDIVGAVAYQEKGHLPIGRGWQKKHIAKGEKSSNAM